MENLAADPTLSLGELGNLKQSPVLHSGGGLLVILLSTILAVYKPWGLTPYGRRQRNAGAARDPESTATLPIRAYLLLGTLTIVVLFLVWHLISGGPHGH
jgi:hypothetical protein